MGMLNLESIRSNILEFISKDKIKEKMNDLSSKLPPLVKYKLIIL